MRQINLTISEMAYQAIINRQKAFKELGTRKTQDEIIDELLCLTEVKSREE